MAVAAAVHHQFQLGLQSCEASDAVLDFAKAGLGDAVGGGARLIRIVLQSKQSSDGVDLKSQLARVTNEGEPGHFRLAVAALLAFAARGAGIRATDS